MRKIELGCCAHTVEEFAARPADTLYKLADLGYSTIEIGDFSPLGARQFADTLKKAGLTATSMHMSFDYQKIWTPHIMDFADSIGIRYIVCPMPLACMNSADGYKAGAEALNELGRIYNENGLKLMYHNHNFEFERFGDKTGHQILLENTDPEYVGFELDTFWLSIAGEKPEEYIRRLKGRVEIVHLKDRLRDEDDVTAVGSGILDFKAILAACEEIGVRIVFVEKDGGVLADARSSYAYLDQLMNA